MFSSKNTEYRLVLWLKKLPELQKYLEQPQWCVMSDQNIIAI
jgi:hypothetical protein